MTLSDILDWHFRRYPLLQARDIYKLVHQGVFGPGHLVDDEQRARQALVAELAEVAVRCCVQTVERLEPLDPEGRLIRVNLETLRRVPDAADRVLGVLVATARSFAGDASIMARRLDEALEWCVREIPEQSGILAQMDEPQPDGFPALHHSLVYRTAYRPSYRVLDRGLWLRVDPGDDADAAGGPDVPPRPSGTTG